VNISLHRLEAIIGDSGIAPRIEALLPAGVRHRQLTAGTLILGMMLALADRRPAHITEVHAHLTALPAADQVRLGVLPPGRVHLPPHHQGPRERHPGRHPLRGPYHGAG
jgi:hypothetical protein